METRFLLHIFPPYHQYESTHQEGLHDLLGTYGGKELQTRSFGMSHINASPLIADGTNGDFVKGLLPRFHGQGVTIILEGNRIDVFTKIV